jgi:ubiquinone biosynthesis protein COQ9
LEIYRQCISRKLIRRKIVSCNPVRFEAENDISGNILPLTADLSYPIAPVARIPVCGGGRE